LQVEIKLYIADDTDTNPLYSNGYKMGFLTFTSL